MDDNKNSSKTNNETNWLSKSTLKDWQVIVGLLVVLGGGWWNLATNNANTKSEMGVLTKEIAELKVIVKDGNAEQKEANNVITKGTNANTVGIEILKVRVENIEKTLK